MQVAHPHSGSSSTRFLVELEFGNVGFWGEGNPEYPEKNLSEQGREPTTNSTHIWRRRRELNPGHIVGRRVLSPMRHPCSPNFTEDSDKLFSKQMFLNFQITKECQSCSNFSSQLYLSLPNPFQIEKWRILFQSTFVLPIIPYILLFANQVFLCQTV